MSWYYHTDAAEAKARIQKEIAKRKKRGESFRALEAPQGNAKLVKSFWGKAWNDNLESYRDYEYRLPRGRSYLRQGKVYDLEIEAGVITATVAGSELYEVIIKIAPLPSDSWEHIKSQCAGQVQSMLDLLAGKLGDGVLRIITDPDSGLFPKSKEIRFSCSCPDHADMCKHVAATLYGVGVKLDTQPDLFFLLRSVDPTELLGSAPSTGDVNPQSSLADEDLSALFGIEIDMAPINTEPAPVPETPKKKAGRKIKQRPSNEAADQTTGST